MEYLRPRAFVLFVATSFDLRTLVMGSSFSVSVGEEVTSEKVRSFLSNVSEQRRLDSATFVIWRRTQLKLAEQ